VTEEAPPRATPEEQDEADQEEVDETSEESFPASDPPSTSSPGQVG
jgi:hypothetical protein